MLIGILEVELLIPGNDSLKGKRTAVKSLVARLRNSFNVSVAEVGDQDRKRRSVIAAVCVGNDRGRIDEIMANMVNSIERTSSVQLLDYSTHII